jgi:hypothetical protein
MHVRLTKLTEKLKSSIKIDRFIVRCCQREEQICTGQVILVFLFSHKQLHSQNNFFTAETRTDPSKVYLAVTSYKDDKDGQ